MLEISKGGARRLQFGRLLLLRVAQIRDLDAARRELLPLILERQFELAFAVARDLGQAWIKPALILDGGPDLFERFENIERIGLRPVGVAPRRENTFAARMQFNRRQGRTYPHRPQGWRVDGACHRAGDFGFEVGRRRFQRLSSAAGQPRHNRRISRRAA